MCSFTSPRNTREKWLLPFDQWTSAELLKQIPIEQEAQRYNNARKMDSVLKARGL